MPKVIETVNPDKKSKPGHRTLPLRDIYRITPLRYKERAAWARIKSLKRRIKKDDGRQIILAVTYTTRNHEGVLKQDYDLHYQMVEAVQDQKHGRILWNTKVKVSCSCLDFMFVDEVSLFKRSNADIYFSNGEMPNIKNPKLVPQCCKHLVHVMKKIRQRGW